MYLNFENTQIEKVQLLWKYDCRSNSIAAHRYADSKHNKPRILVIILNVKLLSSSTRPTRLMVFYVGTCGNTASNHSDLLSDGFLFLLVVTRRKPQLALPLVVHHFLYEPSSLSVQIRKFARFGIYFLRGDLRVGRHQA